MLFAGIASPESNFHQIPNEWIDIIAQMTTLAEVKVVNYILRHTWGFQERDIPQHLTVDEFVNGRAVKEETAKIKGYAFREGKYRMDLGTQLSDKSVRNGLQEAIKRGLVLEYMNSRDKARIDKYYLLLIKGKDIFIQYRGAQITDRCMETLTKFGYRQGPNGTLVLDQTEQPEENTPQHMGEEEFTPQDIAAGGKNLHPNMLGEENLHLQDIGGGGKILPPRGVKSSHRTDKDTLTKKDNLSVHPSIKNNHQELGREGRIEGTKTEIIGGLTEVMEHIEKELALHLPPEQLKKLLDHGYFESWTGDYGAKAVIYAIDRLLEQENNVVRSVVGFIGDCLDRPHAYPVKVSFKKTKSPETHSAHTRREEQTEPIRPWFS